MESNSELSIEFEALQDEEPNSAIMSYYQDAPKRDIEHGLIQEILVQLLSQPTYDNLRTK